MESSRIHKLQLLENEARSCQRCDLSATRNRVVFSSGVHSYGLVVVGEAPGASEDRDGLPFVGRSGQLITRLIEEEIGLARDNYYITNVIKCRPPSNRKPNSVEIAACSVFLTGQLELLNSQVILAVGEVAARVLTRLKTSVGSMRGQVRAMGGAKVVVTYHPAYALRGGKAIEQAMRSDLRVVGGLLDGE